MREPANKRLITDVSGLAPTVARSSQKQLLTRFWRGSLVACPRVDNGHKSIADRRGSSQGLAALRDFQPGLSGYFRLFFSRGCCCCCWTTGREESAIGGSSGVSRSVARRIQTRAISIRRRPQSSPVTVDTSCKHSRASRRYSSARLSKKRRPLPCTPSLQAETL